MKLRLGKLPIVAAHDEERNDQTAMIRIENYSLFLGLECYGKNLVGSVRLCSLHVRFNRSF